MPKIQASFGAVAVTKTLSDDVRFRVLRALEANQNLSQREISREAGISLGLVNYCVSALADKGQVKVQNFRASNNKLRYAYILTPRGLAEKSRLAAGFLQRKMREYQDLKAEIERLQREVDGVDG